VWTAGRVCLVVDDGQDGLEVRKECRDEWMDEWTDG